MNARALSCACVFDFNTALGAPTPDGLGLIGGKSHNAMEEWLDEKSIVPRAAMLAGLIVKIAEEKHSAL